MRDNSDAATRFKGYPEVNHAISGPRLNLVEGVNWCCCLKQWKIQITNCNELH